MADLNKIRAFCKWAASSENPRLYDFKRWNGLVKAAIRNGMLIGNLWSPYDYCRQSIDLVARRWHRHLSDEEIALMAKNLITTLGAK